MPMFVLYISAEVLRDGAFSLLVSLIILVGIFVKIFCKALVLFNLRISFWVSLMLVEAKYLIIAVFLNCKNANMIFIFPNGFEN